MLCGGLFGDLSNRYLIQEGLEHWDSILAMIPAEGILVQILLKVLSRDRMMRTTDASLYQAPKAFKGVGMSITVHVNSDSVVNPLVLVAQVADSSVAHQLIGIDSGRR